MDIMNQILHSQLVKKDFLYGAAALNATTSATYTVLQYGNRKYDGVLLAHNVTAIDLIHVVQRNKPAARTVGPENLMEQINNKPTQEQDKAIYSASFTTLDVPKSYLENIAALRCSYTFCAPSLHTCNNFYTKPFTAFITRLWMQHKGKVKTTSTNTE